MLICRLKKHLWRLKRKCVVNHSLGKEDKVFNPVSVLRKYYISFIKMFVILQMNFFIGTQHSSEYKKCNE